MEDVLLHVKNLNVVFGGETAITKAVDDLSFTIGRGETLGIVGESGCGKSTAALAIMGLLPSAGKIENGKVIFCGTDLLTLSHKAYRFIRGHKLAMIFQNPMTSLNPYLTIGYQIAEPLRQHLKLAKKEARQRTLELLDIVDIPFPQQSFYRYPHSFSGGQQQRVMIAMALTCNPKLLIADEPTTALDVTTQARILNLLKNLTTHRAMSLMLITHDLGVVAGTCDRGAVMYAGQIVELAPTKKLFKSPLHPYTRKLLAAVPALGKDNPKLQAKPFEMTSNPSPDHLGCRFEPRCPNADEKCRQAAIRLVKKNNDHYIRCRTQSDCLMA
jgi:peptide/nickel transport system ATP-binding protein